LTQPPPPPPPLCSVLGTHAVNFSLQASDLHLPAKVPPSWRCNSAYYNTNDGSARLKWLLGSKGLTVVSRVQVRLLVLSLRPRL